MKFFACVIVATAATLVSTSAATAAQPATVSVQHAKPDKPDKKDPPGKAKGHHKHPAKPKPANPGKAKGHAHADGAVGNDLGTKEGASSSPGRSANENKKITFCHVPPGNPANGHLITTSVNAIVPGHSNHPGDIIPPFTYVKHGKTVTFPGKNWDAAGRAILANGCKPVAAGPGSGGGTTTGGGKSTTTSAADKDGSGQLSALRSVMPNTGGPRLAILGLALGLVSAGGLLLARRRKVV